MHFFSHTFFQDTVSYQPLILILISCLTFGCLKLPRRIVRDLFLLDPSSFNFFFFFVCPSQPRNQCMFSPVTLRNITTLLLTDTWLLTRFTMERPSSRSRSITSPRSTSLRATKGRSSKEASSKLARLERFDFVAVVFPDVLPKV